MTVTFDIPPENQYFHALGDDADVSRPIFTGDVFANLSVPGAPTDPDPLAAIVAHPCSMRAGARLKPRILAARILADGGEMADFRTGHYSKFPLPTLGGGRERLYVIRLEDIGVVTPTDLQLENRLACLSREAIAALQQKLIYMLTRCPVHPAHIVDAMLPQLEEADLLESWNAELLDATLVELDGDEGAALDRLANDFDVLLGPPHETESIRARLSEEITRTSARKDVFAAIAERRTQQEQPTGD